MAGSWNATSSSVIQRFSAVGYLVATKLRSMLGVSERCISTEPWVEGRRLLQHEACRWLSCHTLRPAEHVIIQRRAISTALSQRLAEVVSMGPPARRHAPLPRQVPIGIVESDFGGTSIVDWLPSDVTAAMGGDAAAQANPKQNLYNAMISVLGLVGPPVCSCHPAVLSRHLVPGNNQP